MVMMYSVTFTSFASINDVKVHYHGGSSTGPFIVTTVINGTTTYTAITDLNKGSRYEGHFVPSLPLNKGDKLIGTGVITTCLLYTSDAADEEDSVDLGGRRIIKK